MATTAPSPRAQAHAATRAAILAAARTRLAAEGPTQLSLRAVARDVGMVSSAVYRYFPSRDDLLTALLVEAYDALGTAVEAADAALPRDRVGARWVAAGRAVRRWSVADPHAFALLFGSPVPGYAAPQDTVEPATRTTLVLVRIVADAALRADGRPGTPPAPTAAPDGVAAAVADAMAFLERRGVADAMPPELVLRTVSAWTTLFGTVSFELFGHYTGSVSDPAAYFDQVLARLADGLGFAAEF